VAAENKTENRFPCRRKILHGLAQKTNFPRSGGLVAQLVEQCPFNSKTPILAIFSSFYFPFATIAKPLISLVIIRISMSSLVVS